MKGGYMSKRRKKKKPEIDEEFDSYKDYEPDGRDLAAFHEAQEECKKQNPDFSIEDAADYYAELQGEIERGK